MLTIFQTPTSQAYFKERKLQSFEKVVRWTTTYKKKTLLATLKRFKGDESKLSFFCETKDEIF